MILNFAWNIRAMFESPEFRESLWLNQQIGHRVQQVSDFKSNKHFPILKTDFPVIIHLTWIIKQNVING